MPYPPNHDFTYDGLVPGPQLRKRVAAITKLEPTFFDTAGHFLDAGCNRGFFALLAESHGAEVVAFDACVEADYRPLWSDYRADGVVVAFSRLTWTEAMSEDDHFDTAFLGNVWHYAYVERGGWDWVEDLALAVSAGGVAIIEGPIGFRECALMKDCIPEALRAGMTREAFDTAMGLFFRCDGAVESPTDAGRWITSWARRA